MRARGCACAPNVASSLWSTKLEQSERGRTSLPLQGLWKYRQRWRAAGVKVKGEWHWARSCNLSTVHAESFMKTRVCFVNHPMIWQIDSRLILCLDAFPKKKRGPYVQVIAVIKKLLCHIWVRCDVLLQSDTLIKCNNGDTNRLLCCAHMHA